MEATFPERSLFSEIAYHSCLVSIVACLLQNSVNMPCIETPLVFNFPNRNCLLQTPAPEFHLTQAVDRQHNDGNEAKAEL